MTRIDFTAQNFFDARIGGVARQFEDFQTAERAGAMLIADSVDDLAAKMRLPADTFAAEWRSVETLKNAIAWISMAAGFPRSRNCDRRFLR